MTTFSRDLNFTRFREYVLRVKNDGVPSFISVAAAFRLPFYARLPTFFRGYHLAQLALELLHHENERYKPFSQENLDAAIVAETLNNLKRDLRLHFTRWFTISRISIRPQLLLTFVSLTKPKDFFRLVSNVVYCFYRQCKEQNFDLFHKVSNHHRLFMIIFVVSIMA